MTSFRGIQVRHFSFAKFNRVAAGAVLAFQWLGIGIAMGASPGIALAHGYMAYPPSRSIEVMHDDQKAWPIAGIKESLSRVPCIGLKPNKTFTKVKPGPLKLQFVFPDGANHTGYCTAYLYDPLEPTGTRMRISETSDCGRSMVPGAGRKGTDIPGEMTAVIPSELTCDPAHCVLEWQWTATHKSKSNIERFEHYDSCADLIVIGARRVSTATAPVPHAAQSPLQVPVVRGEVPVSRTEFFDQDWALNMKRSTFYLQSVKNKSTFETHGFTHIEGKIGKGGEAQVTLDLASFDTGIDLRNVRMRYLFFQTFRYPHAVIKAQLDKAQLDSMLSTVSLTYPLKFTIELHGITRELTHDVVITRIAGNAISVAVTKPIVILASDFGLTDGVSRLENAVRDVVISPVASITFDLIFEGEKINPEVAAINTELAGKLISQQYQSIDASACATRLSVLSDSQSISFEPGSANLSVSSGYALDTIADFIFLCPNVGVIVAGHTDNIGSAKLNQSLSQQRAERVVEYLVEKGIEVEKLQAVGFGDARPAVPNDSTANRAKNRRIEFTLKAVTPSN
jgi:OOP family OmpA-OmpF porin